MVYDCPRTSHEARMSELVLMQIKNAGVHDLQETESPLAPPQTPPRLLKLSTLFHMLCVAFVDVCTNTARRRRHSGAFEF